MAAEVSQPQLSHSVVTRTDVGHLLREAEAIDNFLAQAAVRQPGTPLQLPRTSHVLNELVNLNHLNMLQPVDRARLLDFLRVLHDKAPLLHMSFSTDPSPLFQQRLITWIRQQLHPYALLQIGLQPNMGAGCMLRTTNKYFDFSLRQRFTDQHDVLMAHMRAIVDKPAPPTPPVKVEVVAT